MRRPIWLPLALALMLLASPISAVSGIFEEMPGSGIDFTYWNGATGEYYLTEITCGGAALVDYDDDGDLDLYLVQGNLLTPGKTAADATFPPPGPLPLTDRLFRDDQSAGADGRVRVRFADVTAAAGLGSGGYGCGVASGDYDGDGRVDLYVTRFGHNQLLRNRGNGTFEDTTAAAGADDPRWSTSATFVDYDGDGDLDLFVANYTDFTIAGNKVCRSTTGARDYCNPDAYHGVPDRLLRNRGDGTFEDVSQTTGIGRVTSKSLGVVASDLDGDGRTDFYVTNDGVPNQLWIQQPDGTFRDQAMTSGSAVNSQGRAEASMGVLAADLDNDGDDDLFMTHLTGETDTLYENDGHGLFEDVTARAAVGPPSWRFTSWGVAPVDYDNDGWLDLAIANGAVRAIADEAAAGDPFPFHQPNQLFHNLGGRGPRFADVSGEAGAAFTASEVSRGLAAGDLDGDGDADLVLVNNNGPTRVLFNRVGQDRHRVEVDVRTPAGGPALGARVELGPTGHPLVPRRVHTDGSFASASDPRLLFGLGDLAGPVTLTVTWPGGAGQIWEGLAADRRYTLSPADGDPAP